MPSYAAFLGHQPHISIAELSASVPGFSLERVLEKQFVVFQSEEELDADFMRCLGGTIVLAQQLEPKVDSLKEIPKAFVDQISGARGKVVFAIRTIGVSPKAVHTLYRVTKDAFKKKGRGCRYIGNEKKPALPVMLHDHDMLTGKNGCELTILVDENFFWVGRTMGAQDVNAYTKRDIKKPVRDTTVGLLPPKLAQILLNFGLWLEEDVQSSKPTKKRWKKKVLTVLDPFCGTGVIPMECLARGWHSLASDSSQKAVNGCTKNIEWFRKEEKILKKDVECTIWKQDALKEFALKTFPDVIVTETTLGPNFSKRPTQKEITSARAELEKIESSFLQNAKESLPGVPLVCTWPVWYGSKDSVMLEKIWKAIDDAGYEAVLPPGVSPTLIGRTSLLYRRPDQFLGREIVMLRPKK